jgi:hypothetical protein
VGPSSGRTVTIPKVAGIGAVAIGAVLVVIGRKKETGE